MVVADTRAMQVPPSKKVPDIAHSLPTNIPLVAGLDNVQRTPRTPRGTLLDRQSARFYPVVKDGAKLGPQVPDFCLVCCAFCLKTVDLSIYFE